MSLTERDYKKQKNKKMVRMVFVFMVELPTYGPY